jgi:hypothetical protein
MGDNRSDYKDTPTGQRNYWETELKASNKRLKKFHKTGDKVVKLYLGELKPEESSAFQLNMLHSNVTTVASMLYGNLPKVDVSRRFSDPDDDISRVASTVLDRILNTEIEDKGDDYNSIFEALMQDRLLPGLAVARVRYEVETGKDEFGLPCVVNESAPIDYYHWRDVAWGWGRSFSELPWIAFRSYLSKEEVKKRFGDEIADNISMKRQMVDTEDSSTSDDDTRSPWDKAEIWEIWDKTTCKVIWYSDGYDKILDTKEDPLGLRNFFPCPQFFMANATTSLYVPKADYKLAEDLYQEIDILQSRIAIITEAVKVVGVYDKSAEGIKRVFNEGVDNDLIPVDNWAMFAEKGGIAGAVDWLPIEAIVGALDRLTALRDDTIRLLQQVTGMADIMQGSLNNQYEGVGQSNLKAQFGSFRIQKLQESFANFVSGLMAIKAEIIALHFDPKTIAIQSNMQGSPDAEMLPQAIQLIKNPEQARIKVKVRSESLATTDFASLQQERGNFLNALSTYLQSAAPLIESEPAAKPFLMKMLSWALAGYKGASEIEGVLDQAIAASEAQAKQQEGKEKPDPEQVKAQAAQQLEQTKMQGEMQKIQAKSQADIQLRQADMQADIQTAAQIHQMKMLEIQAGMSAKIAEEQAKLEAGLLMEQAQAQSSIMQTEAQVSGEILKDESSAKINMVVETQKTNQKIEEISASAISKMAEQKHAVDIQPKGDTDGKGKQKTTGE